MAIGLWNFLIILEPDPVIFLSIDKAICTQSQTKKRVYLEGFRVRNPVLPFMNTLYIKEIRTGRYFSTFNLNYKRQQYIQLLAEW